MSPPPAEQIAARIFIGPGGAEGAAGTAGSSTSSATEPITSAPILTDDGGGESDPSNDGSESSGSGNSAEEACVDC
jgi:hypothetical protein